MVQLTITLDARALDFIERQVAAGRFDSARPSYAPACYCWKTT
jgi:hypothetical protein